VIIYKAAGPAFEVAFALVMLTIYLVSSHRRPQDRPIAFQLVTGLCITVGGARVIEAVVVSFLLLVDGRILHAGDIEDIQRAAGLSPIVAPLVRLLWAGTLVLVGCVWWQGLRASYTAKQMLTAGAMLAVAGVFSISLLQQATHLMERALETVLQ
jgi:hypothetical protein